MKDLSDFSSWTRQSQAKFPKPERSIMAAIFFRDVTQGLREFWTATRESYQEDHLLFDTSPAEQEYGCLTEITEDRDPS